MLSRLQRAQEEKGQREARVAAEAPSTQRPAAGIQACCGWATTCQSAEFSSGAIRPSHPPTTQATLPMVPFLQASPFQLSGV